MGLVVALSDLPHSSPAYGVATCHLDGRIVPAWFVIAQNFHPTFRAEIAFLGIVAERLIAAPASMYSTIDGLRGMVRQCDHL